MKFTDRFVQSLKAKGKRYIAWEAAAYGLGNLGVRVGVSGRRKWIYMYRASGTAKMKTLGAYPKVSVAEAHAMCATAMSTLEKGQDPFPSTRGEVPATTVAYLIKEYLSKWAKPHKRASSYKCDEGMLRRHVPDEWKARGAATITKREVAHLLQAIVDRGKPSESNHLFAVVRKMFNFGIEQDLVRANPCAGLRKLAPEKQRERVLSEAELKIVLGKLAGAHLDRTSQLVIKFQLLTATRIGEVLNVRRSEIDQDARWWTIPGDKAKNKKSHRVPLSEQAMQVLKDAATLPGVSDEPEQDYVFPSPVRSGEPMLSGVLGRGLHRSLPVFGIPAWRTHDLRRTAASMMAGLGVNRLVLERILNHTDHSVTAIYDRHSYDSEKRAALEAWGAHVERLESSTFRVFAR